MIVTNCIHAHTQAHAHAHTHSHYTTRILQYHGGEPDQYSMNKHNILS